MYEYVGSIRPSDHCPFCESYLLFCIGTSPEDLRSLHHGVSKSANSDSALLLAFLLERKDNALGRQNLINFVYSIKYSRGDKSPPV